MKPKDLQYLIYLNTKEKELDEIQEDIDRARRKYFDVSVIQLKLDRRQEELDRVKKGVMNDKAKILNPN